MYMAISLLFVLFTLIATPTVGRYCGRSKNSWLSRCFCQCNEVIIPENKMTLAGNIRFNFNIVKDGDRKDCRVSSQCNFGAHDTNKQLHQKLYTIKMNTRYYSLSTSNWLNQSATLESGRSVLVIAYTFCLSSNNWTGAEPSITDCLCLGLRYAHVSDCHSDSGMPSCNGGLMI